MFIIFATIQIKTNTVQNIHENNLKHAFRVIQSELFVRHLKQFMLHRFLISQTMGRAEGHTHRTCVCLNKWC